MECTPVDIRARLGARSFAILAACFALTGVAVCSLASASRASATAPEANSAAAVDQASGLLLERVRAIHAATPARRYPLGTGRDGVLRFARGWTSGFWPQTLWRASDLGGSEFRGWAKLATRDHFGHERTDTHDLGFMYGGSSVAAYERLCPGGAGRRTCQRLKRSGLLAADTLMKIAASASASGMIPTRTRSCSDCTTTTDGETIIDSMMNLPLLVWASRVTGRQSYRRVARRHALRTAVMLQRPDGSTYQSVEYSRLDGSWVDHHTHQGFGDQSTWARGQAWSIYGFAVAGGEFRDRSLLAVAERNAAYVADHLPAGGVPRWDYDSLPGSPVDVSAGVITAAGLFRLAESCRLLPGACGQATRWRPLAERMLVASLSGVSHERPVGYLGNQVYTLGGTQTWDDDGELVFGLNYALEAIELSRRR